MLYLKLIRMLYLEIVCYSGEFYALVMSSSFVDLLKKKTLFFQFDKGWEDGEFEIIRMLYLE